MCCPLCINATQQNSKSKVGALHEFTEAAVSISNTNWTDFKKHNDGSMRHVVETLRDNSKLLQDKAIGADDFEELEMVKGWNWHPVLEHTILSKKFNLKIASMLMFDAAHILVHDGIADNELGQCMKKFVRSPTSYVELGAYAKNFTMSKYALDLLIQIFPYPSCADHSFLPPLKQAGGIERDLGIARAS